MISLLSSVLVFTVTLFSFQLSGVRGCESFTAVDKSKCSSALKENIVAGLEEINDCMKAKMDRRSRNLKGSVTSNAKTMRGEKEQEEQGERKLQLPTCKCCSATGGGGYGCPHWWCVGPGGCSRRDQEGEMGAADVEQERTMKESMFDGFNLGEVDNSDCKLPLKDGTPLGKCLASAVTAVSDSCNGV
ncbi:hypothetical protein ACA910_008844 [Epithemia clementina (nom. ined.)]